MNLVKMRSKKYYLKLLLCVLVRIINGRGFVVKPSVVATNIPSGFQKSHRYGAGDLKNSTRFESFMK